VLQARARFIGQPLIAFAAQSGESLAGLLALVGLDQREARELLDFVRGHPETAEGVQRALDFRVRVLDELESLTSAQRKERQSQAEIGL
jgi:hypothetical protein